MPISSDARPLRKEQHRVEQAQRRLEDRQWLRDVTLALVLILATITVATALARWGASGK
jgi:hypothetical protein